jgi:protein-S-isoprenylcysteine O-methyltransferase Ste14
MAGFVGNVFVPKSIDTPGTVSAGWAVLINLGLIAMFGLQHSIMARPAFKEIWTRLIPKPIERSTYVFISCVVTAILMWQWQGIDWVVWDVQNPLGRAILWGLFAVGWLLVPVASLMINHFDLFGTRQVWLYLRGLPFTSLPFRTPYLYARVRHPLYLGWATAFWATPTMTMGHLLFAGVLSLYMVAAAFIEEHDLVDQFGDAYREYQQRVPKFIPSLGRVEDAPLEGSVASATVPAKSVGS